MPLLLPSQQQIQNSLPIGAHERFSGPLKRRRAGLLRYILAPAADFMHFKMKIEPMPGDSAFERAIDSIPTNERIVVIGNHVAREMVEEQLEESGLDPDVVLGEAQGLSAANWFRKRIQTYIVENEVEVGVWPPTARPKRYWSLDRDILTKTIHDKVYVAKVMAEKSWQIPAEFSFGGGNDCPTPEVHCAIWRDWEARFAAHIVGMSHDVIEAKVFSPPDSKELALELAKEHYVYCSDIVNQGLGSIADLAAALRKADKWHFWWD
jgi:hypothetical protein